MKYEKLRDATAGKLFIRKQDGKKFTRTQFFFMCDDEEISMTLNGYEGSWMLRGKEGWRDGEYLDRKKEPITMYG